MHVAQAHVREIAAANIINQAVQEQPHCLVHIPVIGMMALAVRLAVGSAWSDGYIYARVIGKFFVRIGGDAIFSFCVFLFAFHHVAAHKKVFFKAKAFS